MYTSKEVKKAIFKEHGQVETNTGSAEGQIAMFSHRIKHLTEHLKVNRKDFNSQLAIQKMVAKRRRQLDYLMKKDVFRYRAIIKALDLRR